MFESYLISNKKYSIFNQSPSSSSILFDKLSVSSSSSSTKSSKLLLLLSSTNEIQRRKRKRQCLMNNNNNRDDVDRKQINDNNINTITNIENKKQSSTIFTYDKYHLKLDDIERNNDIITSDCNNFNKFNNNSNFDNGNNDRLQKSIIITNTNKTNTENMATTTTTIEKYDRNLIKKNTFNNRNHKSLLSSLSSAHKSYKSTLLLSSSSSSSSSSLDSPSLLLSSLKSFKFSLLVFHLLTLLLLSSSISSILCSTILDTPTTKTTETTTIDSIAKFPIHKQMTKQDLLSVFYVDSHDKVPEYELSNVRLLSKRSIDNYDPDNNDDADNDQTKHEVHLKAFGKKMRLKLKDNNEFNERVKDMKVILAETSRNGRLQYVEDLTASDSKNIGTSYHDEDNMAAIFLDHDSKGKVRLHGTIGNDLVIKPIPETISSDNHPLMNEINTDNDNNNEFNNNSIEPDDDELFLNDDDFKQFKWQQHNRNLHHQNNDGVNTPYSNGNNQSNADSTNNLKKLLKENYHVIYKRKFHQHFQPNDFAVLEHGDGANANILSPQWLGSFNETVMKRSARRKRQAPGTVWPEVLLVVDYDSFMLHGATSRDVKRYFISFWNGVDLRYKLLAHPQIRVSLAGMIVAKDRDATPYLERNRLRPPNADAVDAAGALTDMGKYLYREDRLPTYDMAVVITKLDMCRRRYEGGRCNRGTAGFAYVGGACVVNKRLEKVNSVAIIEDSGGYSGIIVAAHEVGHLLGCVHDGSPPPSYLGGPGATRCPWEDGFIMSDLRHTERGFRWSTCSVEQFKHFLNGETATCLYNFPHENQLLPRVLPGSMLSLDEQCKRDRGTNACFKDSRVCAQLFCFDSASGYCVSYRPAAEGSSCGDGQICRNGKCLAEMENIIPDYSHVQQSIRPKPDRLLSRIDGPSSQSSPVPPSSSMNNLPPPFRRNLRFPRRDPFFHTHSHAHHHLHHPPHPHPHHFANNFFPHAAASEQIDEMDENSQHNQSQQS